MLQKLKACQSQVKELINVNDIISNTVEKIKNQIGHDEDVELVYNSLDHNIVFGGSRQSKNNSSYFQSAK